MNALNKLMGKTSFSRLEQCIRAQVGSRTCKTAVHNPYFQIFWTAKGGIVIVKRICITFRSLPT